MKVAVVGLGYVGLPLAHILAKSGHETYGYDIDEKRIAELASGHDRTKEISDEKLREVAISFSADPAILENAEIVILAIPTPIDDKNHPDLELVAKATETVGKHLRKGMIVVYESTVYPGVTEELCGPILEQESGLVCGKDFTLGYSPERINPGDKEHTVDRIAKVVAGQDERTLWTLCALYGSITKGGIHAAPNIKVAEMAKAIENAQRDLNIAFVNEIAMLCRRIGISSKDVLAAAATKWNFLPFKPGLVGGHCIGVDPYYLVEKARQLGMQTHVITAGRTINDGMSGYIAEEISTALRSHNGLPRILVLGITFKENIPDTRNSKARNVVEELQKRRCIVEVHDPEVPAEELQSMGLVPGSLANGPYDAVAYLVPHREYAELPLETLLKATREGGVIFDLQSMLDGKAIREAGRTYIAL